MHSRLTTTRSRARVLRSAVCSALVIGVCATAHGESTRQDARSGGVNVAGDAQGSVVIINGASADVPIPPKYAKDGAAWVSAGDTVDILDGKVSITVVKIVELSRRHVARVEVKAPRRKPVVVSKTDNGYGTFEYNEDEYRLDILDVQLDAQRVLLRVKQMT